MSFNKCAGIYDQLQDLVNDTQSDMTKFVEGNNSAGTRVRKAMQAIKGLAQELRVEVQNQNENSKQHDFSNHLTFLFRPCLS